MGISKKILAVFVLTIVFGISFANRITPSKSPSGGILHALAHTISTCCIIMDVTLLFFFVIVYIGLIK